MSLDVYLRSKKECPHCGKEVETGEEVFSANITHNLGGMAEEGGVYKHIWRPEELGIKSASELIEPLSEFVRQMKETPTRFEAHNSSNGWGLYKNFLPWCEKYLEACIEYPNASVYASR